MAIQPLKPAAAAPGAVPVTAKLATPFILYPGPTPNTRRAWFDKRTGCVQGKMFALRYGGMLRCCDCTRAFMIQGLWRLAVERNFEHQFSPPRTPAMQGVLAGLGVESRTTILQCKYAIHQTGHLQVTARLWPSTCLCCFALERLENAVSGTGPMTNKAMSSGRRVAISSKNENSTSS